MKKFILSLSLVCLALTIGYSQNSKADKEAAAQAQFNKAVAAIESKEFVIVPDTYDSSTGTVESNADDANFISYEKDFVFLQGMIVCSNSFTNKTTVSDYKQEIDKRGNLKVEMKVTGSAITARVEISMKKNGNYADVVVTPTKGTTRRFSGEVTPKSESKFFKKPNVV